MASLSVLEASPFGKKSSTKTRVTVASPVFFFPYSRLRSYGAAVSEIPRYRFSSGCCEPYASRRAHANANARAARDYAEATRKRRGSDEEATRKRRGSDEEATRKPRQTSARDIRCTKKINDKLTGQTELFRCFYPPRVRLYGRSQQRRSVPTAVG